MHRLIQWQNLLLPNVSITPAQIAKMRAVVFQDGGIDLQEVDFILAMNRSVGDKATEEWTTFFVEVMLLFGQNGGDTLDASRAEMLKNKLMAEPQNPAIQQVLSLLP